jgi:hypothetical protein
MNQYEAKENKNEALNEANDNGSQEDCANEVRHKTTFLVTGPFMD